MITKETRILYYQLPKIETLNLAYLELTLIVKLLNKHVSEIKHKDNLYAKVAEIMGITERTVWRKINEYNITFNINCNQYYVLDTNPVLIKIIKKDEK